MIKVFSYLPQSSPKEEKVVYLESNGNLWQYRIRRRRIIPWTIFVPNYFLFFKQGRQLSRQQVETRHLRITLASSSISGNAMKWKCRNSLAVIGFLPPPGGPIAPTKFMSSISLNDPISFRSYHPATCPLSFTWLRSRLRDSNVLHEYGISSFPYLREISMFVSTKYVHRVSQKRGSKKDDSLWRNELKRKDNIFSFEASLRRKSILNIHQERVRLTLDCKVDKSSIYRYRWDNRDGGDSRRKNKSKRKNNIFSFEASLQRKSTLNIHRERYTDGPPFCTHAFNNGLQDGGLLVLVNIQSQFSPQRSFEQ